MLHAYTLEVNESTHLITTFSNSYSKVPLYTVGVIESPDCNLAPWRAAPRSPLRPCRAALHEIGTTLLRRLPGPFAPCGTVPETNGAEQGCGTGPVQTGKKETRWSSRRKQTHICHTPSSSRPWIPPNHELTDARRVTGFPLGSLVLVSSSLRASVAQPRRASVGIASPRPLRSTRDPLPRTWTGAVGTRTWRGPSCFFKHQVTKYIL